MRSALACSVSVLRSCDDRRGLLSVQGAATQGGTTSAVLRLEKAQQEFTFTEVAEQPVPSLCRNFSAPVKLQVEAAFSLCHALLANFCLVSVHGHESA